MFLGTGDKHRCVPLEPIYDSLGEKVAAALPGFHCFTGCDTTGRFASKGKPTCWKIFCKAKTSILDALAEFVCKLYKPRTKVTEVGTLRWEIFKHSQGEAEKLPPTADALKHHILRAHYQAMIWHHAYARHSQHYHYQITMDGTR